MNFPRLGGPPLTPSAAVRIPQSLADAKAGPGATKATGASTGQESSPHARGQRASFLHKGSKHKAPNFGTPSTSPTCTLPRQKGRQRGLKGKEPPRVVPDPTASPAHTGAAGMSRRLPAAPSPRCSPRLLSHTIASPGRTVPRRMLGCATWLPRAEVSPVPAGFFTGL